MAEDIQVNPSGNVDPAASLLANPPAQAQPAQTDPSAPAANTNDALASAISQLTAALAPKTQEPAPSTDLNTFDVSSINDPILQSMANVMQTAAAGLDLNRAVGTAIEQGRPELIDFAYIAEKGGANAAAIRSMAQELVKSVAVKAAQVEESIYTLAGGKEQWAASVAVFNQGAPAELKVAVKTLLDSKNEAHIKAGAQLVATFSKSSGALPINNGSIQAGSAAISNAQALNKADFQEALAKLDRNSRNYTAEREALYQRRSLGQQLGL